MSGARPWTREQESRGVAAVKQLQQTKFELGDVGLEVAPLETSDYTVLRDYAAAIGADYDSLRAYRRVAAKWPSVTRVTGITWTVFRGLESDDYAVERGPVGRGRHLRNAEAKAEWLRSLKAALPFEYDGVTYKRVTLDLVRLCVGLRAFTTTTRTGTAMPTPTSEPRTAAGGGYVPRTRYEPHEDHHHGGDRERHEAHIFADVTPRSVVRDAIDHSRNARARFRSLARLVNEGMVVSDTDLANLADEVLRLEEDVQPIRQLCMPDGAPEDIIEIRPN